MGTFCVEKPLMFRNFGADLRRRTPVHHVSLFDLCHYLVLSKSQEDEFAGLKTEDE